MIEPLDEALTRADALLANSADFRRIVLSGKQRSKSPEFQRIDVRPVEIKGILHFQIVSHDGQKDLTKNVLPGDFRLRDIFDGFGNLIIENRDEELTLRVTKSGEAQVNFKRVVTSKIPGTDVDYDLSHDRKKFRFLQEDEKIFQELGISDHQGRLKPTRSDKFLQVNEFLKILTQAIPENAQKSGSALTLVDLGCGSAYLTFAAHQYLINQGLKVSTRGIDSRSDNRDRNNAVAQKVGFEGSIDFVVSNIADFPTEAVDVTVALHACDTATDDAITWAVKSGSSVILVAPCCQHDIQRQMKVTPAPWNILTKHGILAERLGDLLTDGIRAQILRILGYRTDVIEFIAGDHTPRNLMIRAVFTGAKPLKRDLEELDQLMANWAIQPALIVRLGDLLDAKRQNATE